MNRLVIASIVFVALALVGGFLYLRHGSLEHEEKGIPYETWKLQNPNLSQKATQAYEEKEKQARLLKARQEGPFRVLGPTAIKNDHVLTPFFGLLTWRSVVVSPPFGVADVSSVTPATEKKIWDPERCFPETGNRCSYLVPHVAFPSEVSQSTFLAFSETGAERLFAEEATASVVFSFDPDPETKRMVLKSIDWKGQLWLRRKRHQDKNQGVAFVIAPVQNAEAVTKAADLRQPFIQDFDDGGVTPKVAYEFSLDKIPGRFLWISWKDQPGRTPCELFYTFAVSTSTGWSSFANVQLCDL